MVRQPAAIRAFEALQPVTIYRVAGRRPSDVYVDASGAVRPAGPGAQALKEFVYWKTVTAPGDQIQERVGGFFVVTEAGLSHPIALRPPEPLHPDTAFLHAHATREADSVEIERLLAEGALVATESRRPGGPASRPGERMLPADHPLVVEERPDEIDERPAPSAQRHWVKR